jgi:hypothetical protein
MLSPSPCRIIVTVALADASGAELDSTAHSFEPQSAVGHAGISFVFEKDDQYHHTFGGIDVRISPGLRDPYENFQIAHPGQATFTPTSKPKSCPGCKA